jgi:hypothetical protein
MKNIRHSRDSYGVRSGRPGFYSLQGQEIFPFSPASRPALGPTLRPIKCVPRVKRPGHEADHLSPSIAVKIGGAIPLLPKPLLGVVIN